MEADDDDGIPYRFYIWADNRLLGFIDDYGDDEYELIVAHCDDFGSVIALTDESGNLLFSANYGPHGEDWGSTGYNYSPFGWLGGYGVQTLNDSTPLKLYLTRYRLYSATLNRFLSSDPLGLEGGLNLYEYGLSNPMMYIDPLGLCAQNMSGLGYGLAMAGAIWGGFWEGFGNGLEIVANTFTFGGTDYLGWTDTSQYQGFEYDMSRYSSYVGAGALYIAGGLYAAGYNPVLWGGAATATADRAAPVLQSAQTLGQTVLKGIDDNMLVHFSQTANRTSIVANGVVGNGGSSYFFRVGDVSGMTAAQVRTAIGPLAQGGLNNSLGVIVSPNAANFSTFTQGGLTQYITMQPSVPWTLIRSVPGGVP